MSRWKETLCGSRIKSAEAMNGQQISQFSDSNAVLCCGGQYLPQSATTFSTKPKTDYIFLPKDSYEVIVMHPNQSTLRYGEHGDLPLDVEMADSHSLADTKVEK